MRASMLAVVVSTIFAAVSPGCSSGNSSPAAAPVNTAPALLNAVSPSSGAVAGGTVVTLSGANFDAGTQVSFGGNAAAQVTIISGFSATAVTPRGVAGVVGVTVNNSLGTPASLSGAFTYTTTPAGADLGDVSPTSGPTSGGGTMTLRGWNLSSATTVQFGGNSATSVSNVTPTGIYPTAISCTVPAGSAGDVPVAVTNSDGSRAMLVNGYAYVPGPAITTITTITAGALDPAGGTPVTINGNNFNGPPAITVGGATAATVFAVTAQQVIAYAPAGTAGATVAITVTNPDGQSATFAAAATYANSVTSPTVSAISATSGPATGGAALTLTGTGFVSGASVVIGGGLCSNVVITGPTQLTATSPRTPVEANGAQAVVVVNSDGGTGTLATAFAFDAMIIPAPTGTVVDPDVVIDGAGTVHTVWNTPTGVGQLSDIWYSRSTDGGRTWSTAAQPNSGCGCSPAAIGHRARLAARGSNCAVVWNEQSGTGSRQLFVTISSDGGLTWSNPFGIADNGTTGPWPDPSPAYDAAGDLFIAFRTAGPNAGERGISVLRLGQTSSTPPAVIAGGAIDAADPVIASGASGLLVLAWSQVATAAPGGTLRDIWTTRSTDGGLNWGWPSRRSLPGTTTEGASAPDLAVAITGGTVAVIFQVHITAPCG